MNDDDDDAAAAALKLINSCLMMKVYQWCLWKQENYYRKTY